MAKTKRQQRPVGAASGAASRQSPSGATTTSRAGSTATASRLSEIRARSGVAPRPATRAGGRPAGNQRRYARHLPWWRRNLAAIGTVAAVVVIVVAFIFAQRARNTKAAVGIGDPAPQSILSALSVTGVTPATAAKVGTGGIDIGLEATPPNIPPLTSKGLPEIVYIGAEYCPYCAADRWGTIIALNRFGSFKGITLMKSSSGDVFPNTPTFSFRNATYTSKYIVFSATETEDRNQSPLATPPTDAMNSFATYDTAPYTDQQGGIPFFSFADQYVTTAGAFTPTMLSNRSWQQVVDQLKDPNSAAAKNIIGTANYQTAVICKLTNNQPANVCSASYIQSIEASLPTR